MAILKCVVVAFVISAFLKYNTVSAGCDSKAFEEHKIVPEIVDKTPETFLTVTYDDGAVVSCGNKLNKKQTDEPPTVQYTAEGDSYHALFMIDPDAPDPKNPVLAQFLHWSVYNIPNNDIHAGETQLKYFPPSPLPVSAAHRLIFLLYKQPKKLSNSQIGPGNRIKFDVREHALKLQLGSPIGGNFYLEDDDSLHLHLLDPRPEP